MRSLLMVLTCVLAAAAPAMAQAPEFDAADLTARGLFERGRVAYEIGQYNEALSLFQQAYDNSRRPRLLYNIGQAADRLRLNRTALKAFQVYLEEVPDAENRVEVENRIRVLEQLPDSAPAPAEEPHDPQVSVVRIVETPAKPTNIAPWLVVAAGGVATVTGAVLLVLGSNQISDVENGSSWNSVRDEASSGPTYTAVGVTTMAVGLVGAAVGLAWVIATPDEQTVVSVVPGGVTVRGSL